MPDGNILAARQSIHIQMQLDGACKPGENHIDTPEAPCHRIVDIVARLAGVRVSEDAGLRAALIEWVDAETAYWAHAGTLPQPDKEPDFAPFERWKAAQAKAHELRAALRSEDAGLRWGCKCSPLDGHDEHCEAVLDVDVLADSMRYGYAWTHVPFPDQWPAVAHAVAAEYRRQVAAALRSEDAAPHQHDFVRRDGWWCACGEPFNAGEWSEDAAPQPDPEFGGGLATALPSPADAPSVAPQFDGGWRNEPEPVDSRPDPMTRTCPACGQAMARDDTHWVLGFGSSGGYVCPARHSDGCRGGCGTNDSDTPNKENGS